ncbi:MAG: MBL fold metallo-hydrolase, partial [Candidatus Zixiibacteriota bacterium]
TYGGRLHEPGDVYHQFAEIIDEIVAKKGVLLIPAFALGRTQQVAYLVHRLISEKRIPPITVHIDSPMAITATDLYCKYSEYHAVDINTLGGSKCCLGGGHVKLHRKRKSSLSLNRLKGPAIIMSASGMMTGGRILHHLINRLPSEKTTVAVVGYQAEGTLGRKLVEGEKLVYIHKQPVEVKAKIVNLTGLSGHADYYELLHWLEPVEEMPKMTFITHGEPTQSRAFAGHLKENRGWTATRLPELDEVVTLAE